MTTVLITGFGAFPGVPVNPTEAVARAVDGRVVAGWRVAGRVLPVGWREGPDAAIAAARAVDAALVIGLGVATTRVGVEVETVAVRACDPRPDAFGVVDAELSGPDRVAATVDCARLAEALGASLSTDAGRYVCNAWLYRVSSELTVPVGFVHVPADGIAPDRLLAGVAKLIGTADR